MSDNNTLTMYSGDSRTLLIDIRDNSGVAVDVSTAQSIIYGIFKGVTAVVTKTLGDGITVDENIVTVNLLPLDTASLLGGKYIHEMQIITADDEVSTVLQGYIVIKKDYIE